MYLKTRKEIYDIVAGTSAEIGIVFTTIVLITGPIWGKASWGAWWTWDPRLTTTLILWFIYIAYLIIRSFAIASDKTRRMAAVFGIVGFIDVPIVFMAARWWRTIHPVVFESDRVGLPPSMIITLLICLLTFTLLYVVLMLKGIKIEKAERQLKVIKAKLIQTY